MNFMFKKLRELDCWLDKVAPILILLLIVLVLRVPNFFEPYWYGDEGIYLTIGNALRNGGSLYQSIIDHKTPLIYYFSMVPSQMWFRVLNLVWSGASVLLFFFLANRVIKNIKIVYASSLIFALLVTTPILEGNIPNGELFVMGFILLGGLLFVSHIMSEFVTDIAEKFHRRGCELWFAKKLGRRFAKTSCSFIYFVSGLLFGLAILTKVPAIFDVAAMFSIAWFIGLSLIDWKHLISNKNWTALKPLVFNVALAIAGTLVPIILSVIYYTLIGHGQAYLDFGLLYNFRYVKNWSLPFSHPVLVWLFSMPGKLLITGAIIFGLSFLKKQVSLRFKFVAAWLILALFGSTLSNRPYPHYYLQVVPPAVMMAGFIFEELIKLIGFDRAKKKFNFIDVGIGSSLMALVVAVFILLKVGFYPTISYYTRFIDYANKKISRDEYYQSFDSLMKDNYAAAQIIQKSSDPYMLIWGTNPTLYALTKKIPTGRFIVSFHVRDFDAYQETLDDMVQKKPMFVVTMNNEEPLEGLGGILETEYLPNHSFDHFVLWKKANND
jgi:hypothetical protein